MQQVVTNSTRSVIIVVTAAFIFVALAVWGGMPPAAAMPGFIAGVLVLLAVGGLVSLAGWYLLLRPLPGNVKVVRQSILHPMQRRLIGSLLVLAMLVEVIGGIWDETWHRRYGIPFGKDFFWRPHILIYAGLMAIVLLAGIGWIALMRRGRGSLVQRFRADPVLGVLILTGLFLLYALPADPIWHSIYGTDLSAFSIPHVLLTLLLVIASLSGCALLLTSSPARSWQRTLRFGWDDLLPLLAFVTVLLTTLLLLTADWTGLDSARLASRTGTAFQRPEWLLPTFILAMASLAGVLANETLRRLGVATLVGVISFALRLALVNWFGSPVHDANSWLLCLPSLILIDTLYAYRIRQNQPVPWWMVGVAASLGLAVMLPLMNQLFAYPQVTAGNILVMLIAPLVAALLMAWLGHTIGSHLADAGQPDTAQDMTPVRVARLTAIMLLPLVALLFWFVVTATPPSL